MRLLKVTVTEFDSTTGPISTINHLAKLANKWFSVHLRNEQCGGWSESLCNDFRYPACFERGFS